MLSLPGQFTFTADRPQLHCAAFFIGEPEEFITIHYDLVSIDCQGGDFLKVRGSPLLAAPAHVPLSTFMWGTTKPLSARVSEAPWESTGGWIPRKGLAPNAAGLAPPDSDGLISLLCSPQLLGTS